MTKEKITIANVFDSISPEPNSGCWLWLRGCNTKGYANIKGKVKTVMVHRWLYEHFVKPIPEGLQLDHICRVRCCVNPAHLEPVTCAVNISRGLRHNSSKQFCRQGHPYDAKNTRWRLGKRGMQRDCRACGSSINRKARANAIRTTLSEVA